MSFAARFALGDTELEEIIKARKSLALARAGAVSGSLPSRDCKICPGRGDGGED